MEQRHVVSEVHGCIALGIEGNEERLDRIGSRAQSIDRQADQHFQKPNIFSTKANMRRLEELTKRGETRAGGGGNVFRYNCQPIVEAGQALLVDDGYQLDDTFWLVPTPAIRPAMAASISARAGRTRS